MADRIARELGFNVEEHPADWDRHGYAASPIRNGEMVAAKADRGFAFGPLRKRDGKRTGTGDCYHRMRLAGIPVEHFGAKQAE